MEKWGEKVKTLFSLGTRESGFEGCEKSKLYFRLTLWFRWQRVEIDHNI